MVTQLSSPIILCFMLNSFQPISKIFNGFKVSPFPVNAIALTATIGIGIAFYADDPVALLALYQTGMGNALKL
ncbi:hypothetical protein D9M68_826190 [compost metagenome]